MIPSRQSEARRENPKLVEVERKTGETNSQWLARVLPEGDLRGSILLFGGSGLADFRIRVAQSHARHDLLPSFWSHAAILADSRRKTLWEVPRNVAGDLGALAKSNGAQRGKLASYDDAGRYPNIACIRFGADSDKVTKAIDLFQRQRALIDVPGLIVRWLGYIWGVSGYGNPLVEEMGVPSAAFVEGVFALADFELTPGLSSRSSCPEAIWQSAKWWHEFYTATAAGALPEGAYWVGQPSAAVVEAK